jgi:hypothetical protein
VEGDRAARPRYEAAMTKSATDLMQEIIFSAVLDSIAAMKSASAGLPNNLLRDLNSIHANTTFADLPKEVQSSITASVRSAFTRLLREGYSVSTGQPAPPPRGVPVRRDGPRHDRGPRPPHHDRKGPGGRPGGGARPGGGNRPGPGGGNRPGPKAGGPRRGPGSGGK